MSLIRSQKPGQPERTSVLLASPPPITSQRAAAQVAAQALVTKKPVAPSPPTRKKKTVRRCSSPSHFMLSMSDETKLAPEYMSELPDKTILDNLLRSTSSMYYRQREPTVQGTNVWVNKEYEETEYPSLDMLVSPLRKQTPIEQWSPKEIALFETSMCNFGKDFHHISKIIQTKSTNEVVDFYYNAWKKSTHYAAWKRARNTARTQQKQSQTRALPAPAGSSSASSSASNSASNSNSSLSSLSNASAASANGHASAGAGALVLSSSSDAASSSRTHSLHDSFASRGFASTIALAAVASQLPPSGAGAAGNGFLSLPTPGFPNSSGGGGGSSSMDDSNGSPSTSPTPFSSSSSPSSSSSAAAESFTDNTPSLTFADTLPLMPDATALPARAFAHPYLHPLSTQTYLSVTAARLRRQGALQQ